MKKLAYISAFALFFSFFFSCKKDKVITSSSAKLTFSQDSILFDTVFTSIGSTTKLFRIHNRNNGKLNISSLKLARGSASFFRLNVDGTAGKSFTNLEIAAGDSMYIFVEVTIDPNADPSNSPFIYRDSILFEINGGQQHFDLIAFGQNAYYHIANQTYTLTVPPIHYDTLPVPIFSTDTFRNDKPHLIYGYTLVDSYQKLYIEAGAKIYVHNGGGIWVFQNGSINIAGTEANPVTFQGDRLEQEYKDVPGQWDRILINEGNTPNIINYAVIKNAFVGVQASYAALSGFPILYDPNTYSANLTINNTIIQNCSGIGLIGQGYNIRGGNNVVVNCGQHLLEFDDGGNYVFYQSTFANYWAQTNNSSSSSSRTTPSFVFNNYFNGNVVSAFDSLYFGNCIMDGTLAEEFHFDTIPNSTPPGFTKPYYFDHCALKTGMSFGTAHTSSPVIISGSSNPMKFNNTTTYDFSINSNNGSAAQGTGGSIYLSWPQDIKLQPRSFPDLGAYHIQ